MNTNSGDFWKRGETLGEHLERRGIDRREFLGWCAKMAMLMGLGPMVAAGAESFPENALACNDLNDCIHGGLDAAVDSGGRIYILDLVSGNVRVMKRKG